MWVELGVSEWLLEEAKHLGKAGLLCRDTGGPCWAPAWEQEEPNTPSAP